MRVSPQHQTGAVGETEVVLAFERIGWGPIRNSEHDLGTDLFVAVRDVRGEELGLLVGVQVKAGESAFREAVRDAGGRITGWWFRDDDRRHIDGWLRHTVSHIIVLYDERTRLSHWAHVSLDAVVPAGQGAKVLVPASQTIDAEHREALLETAGANRPGVAWEGSAWIGAANVLPRDRLRHALVVPRLIAPHANAGSRDPIDADQAVALMVQARRHELRKFADQHTQVPHLHEVADDAPWRWRFAAALRRRMVFDELEDLIARVADASTPADHAAATVAAAAGLIEGGRIAQALDLLDAAIARDAAETVDYAWLLVQRARARAEVGRLAEAQDDALRAQGVRLDVPGDATASAVAASAAILLFNTAALGDKDVGAMATSADTASSWWRTQTITTALWGITERSFSAWTDREPTMHADGFPGHNKLTAAALMASHAGEQGSWRGLTAGIAKSDLLALDRHAEPEEAAAGLEQLRVAGDHGALRNAVRRVVADGPARAAAMAAEAVDLDASTRTTVHADLALLAAAGDVLDIDTATRVVAALLEPIAEPARLEKRTVPGYWLLTPLVEALAGAVAAADAVAQRAVAERILNLPAISDYGVARSWTRVLVALPDEAWEAGDAVGLRDSDRHDHQLHMALLGIATRLGDSAARRALARATQDGSFDAVGAIPDITSFPSHALTGFIATIVEGMVRRRALPPGLGIEGNYVGPRLLAELNCVRPDLAQWEPLLDFLADGNVPDDYKSGALQAMSQRTGKLPDDVRDRLRDLALALVEDQRDRDEAVVREATVLAVTFGAYASETAASSLVELLRGDDVARVRALATIENLGIPEEHVGIVVALTGDPDPYVRAWAAALLAIHVDRGAAGALAVVALDTALEDPGVVVPEAIAGARLETKTSGFLERVGELQYHRSAAVRLAAARQVSCELD